MIRMKKLCCFLFFFGLNFEVYCQVKTVDIPVYKNGVQTFWYKWQQKIVAEVGLSDLTKSTDSLHFRFATDTQIIDIRTNDFKKFDGVVYNFTKKYDSKNSNYDTTSVFMNKKKLKQAAAQEIYTVFKNKSIFEIPSEEKIPGWGMVLDGEIYIIEYSTPSQYSMKTYGTPDMFRHRIKEANTIYALAGQLKLDLGLRDSFQKFINHLPKGCYRAGGIMLSCNNKVKK